MEQKQFLRLGAGLLALAVCLRLLAGRFPQQITDFLQTPGVLSFLVYMETGKVIRYPQSSGKEPTVPTEAPEPTFPPETAAPETAVTNPVFSQPYTEMTYHCQYRPDLEALLAQPLDWDLSGSEPTVLILHTHGTESYTPGEEPYEESSPYRTLDEDCNMLSLGEELAALLEAGGISVLHDKTLHDYPSYNSSYVNARRTIQDYLAEYPSIRMVLDLHRDAAETATGQLATVATVGGQRSAQLMMVVGTDAGGNYHPNWQQNLSLALKLSTLLEQNDPGICRPIDLRSERFNMDMTQGSLLVEIGAAGNTRQEARIAVHALAQAILELAQS